MTTDVFAVTPGKTLYVEVAAAGNSGQFCCTANPGGGGKGGVGVRELVDVRGGDGGGASDVRTVSAATAGTLTSRLIVAAGGAGAGGSSQVAGGDAGAVRCVLCTRPGGYPGTLTAGGAGESGALGGGSGSPGSLGVGGDGGNGGAGGGGGGGGLYGGGGGGYGDEATVAMWATSGGGGSSYSQGGATASPTSAPASITFTYVVGAATPPGTTPPGMTPPGTTPPPGSTPPGTAPPGSNGAPVLGELRFSPVRFKAGPLAAGVGGVGTETRTGTTITYAATQAATTTFTIRRRTAFVRRRGRCTTIIKTRPAGQTCFRLVQAGSFSHADTIGENSVRFTGVVRRNGVIRRLTPGQYSIVAVARLGALSSPPVRGNFVVRR